MAENRKLYMSRRDFLRLSALTASGAAFAAGLPEFLARAQEATPGVNDPGAIIITRTSPDRTPGTDYDQVVADAFNAAMQKAGQNWRVQLNFGPATDNDYVAKLNLDAASGQSADVSNVNWSAYQDMAAAGYLLDITDKVNAWDEWPKFAQVVKDQITIGGKVYGVAGATTFTFFYRKDVLEKAGIKTDQPKTWDDLYSLADDIVSKTGAMPFGIPAARPWGGGTWEEGFRHVWLGFAKDNEIFDTTDNKWVVSSDGLLKALQVYETLAKNKWLPVQDLLTPNPWEPIKYQAFVQGKLIVATGGDWQWEFDWGPKGQNPIDDIFNKVDRWQFPSVVGDPFTFAAAGGPDCISATTQNADGAFEVVKAFFEPATTCKALEVYFGGPSPITDYGDSCPFYNTAIDGKMAEASKLFASGRYIKTGPGESKIADGIAQATESVITGQQSAQEAMDAFAAAMSDAIGDDGIKKL